MGGNFEPSTYCWIFALVLELRDALVSDVFRGHGGVNALQTVLLSRRWWRVSFLPHLTLYIDAIVFAGEEH